MLNACGGLMAALWRWLGKYVAFRHVLLAVALLAILYLQVCTLFAGSCDHLSWMDTAVTRKRFQRRQFCVACLTIRLPGPVSSSIVSAAQR